MKHIFSIVLLLVYTTVFAQKKPLDHSVYDGWQSIGERIISADGKWVAYTITPQEGDADLFIRSADNISIKTQIPRGYNPRFTEDSRFLVFRIRAFYKETRDARIKKKKPEDFPKDSIGIVELGKGDLVKIAKVKSFKMPEKASGWLAYHREKDPAPKSTSTPTQKTVDSLKKTIDSLVMLVTQIKNIKAGSGDGIDADDNPSVSANMDAGSDLVLRNLYHAEEKMFKNVIDYFINDLGNKLLMRVGKTSKDSLSRNAVVVYDLKSQKLDTILKDGNDFKGFAMTEDGSKVAFVAERDTAKKALQKFYQLFVYKEGLDSAEVLIDKNTPGMKVGMTVSEYSNITFSKSGQRLFFGTAAIQPPKDTSLIEVDLVKLDIWHYKDDYLQTQQLYQLNNTLRRNFLAVFDFPMNKMEQLGSEDYPFVFQTNEGDGSIFYASTDTGRRVQRQWGINLQDVYAIQLTTGSKRLVKRNHEGQVYPSSTGKYVMLYDSKVKHYFLWDGNKLKNISAKITVPLYDEEHDSPSYPSPHGVMGWHEGDSSVYVYDKYDVWKLDLQGKLAPVRMTEGRNHNVVYRYLRLDPEERYISNGQLVAFRIQNKINKTAGYAKGVVKKNEFAIKVKGLSQNAFSPLVKAKNANRYLFTRERFEQSPNLYLSSLDDASLNATALTNTNLQQSEYNWGTAELFKWKTFTGKESSGILYKPEDFDPSRKYPMLIYFYEKLSDNLYSYSAPAPTPSRLNVPFFVSRGYLVFTPDISYTKGQPGKDAYNYIVSGAQALAKNKWVDAKNIGIQGQSWGGYQVLALIVQTPMFKAAWAGAPVANMTSAYGGIRWESGLNRQFQYEKTQSRIGATLWERQDLYIKSSPLFQVPKIKTPLVIMHNDADGAVPWYQGIEMFTAMRRLNKPVWMLNYNGEAHNLVERKNRKDIQIRQQQYFDWLLKGEKPAKWITEGVPAVKKGKDWGLEIID